MLTWMIEYVTVRQGLYPLTKRATRADLSSSLTATRVHSPHY